MPFDRRSLCLLVAVFLSFFCAFSGAHAALAPKGNGYAYYAIGDLKAPTPGKVEPGAMLMGGGDWVDKAFAWLSAKAGHGHILILRASGAEDLQEDWYRRIGGVASVETIVFSARDASSNADLLARVRRADGIFLAGGDQSNYVRYWKGTPMQAALNDHVRAGKPIGGSSAGLAVLGAHVYGAMDGGSVTSPEALADPLGPAVTLVEDFLHLPFLAHVVTDTHFAARDRLGRLLAFIARERTEGDRAAIGIGVDERTALCIDGRGQGQVFTSRNGFAWVVTPAGQPAQAKAGQALGFADVRVVGVGPQSRLDLTNWHIEKPAFQAVARVDQGKLQLHGEQPVVLAIHGGAGVEKAGMTPQSEAQARAALELALRRGYEQLRQGRPAMDAVTAAITSLEDDPLFNAGRGAVFTHDGRNELDASVMDGATLAAGAVAGVHRVKNPVLLARAVMEHSSHVMLMGDGAEQFASEQGVSLVDPTYFRTERRWQELQQALKQENKQASALKEGLRHFGTVGAVARDDQGRLAAGTSTGGMTNKRYGRVGDSPVIGAGTYADVNCAVSGTGWGEYYLRVSAARDICMRMGREGASASEAGRAVINEEIPGMGGDGGAIVLGRDGEVALPFNTEGMYRGWVGADGVPHVAIYREDPLVLPAPSH
ncbi:peptidase T [Dyella terrae]|uniref:Isoaspartyl peptidase n=2 Tax=Dyella TaxID=231454 RepID=A0A4R0YJR3_9GAMM|nr:peptidase T [Dyella terrae]TCI07638.1 peptidase T [Dyella soli]